ncbi:transposase, partial [Salmonella enterica]|uniref:transposase n=1 Tax=Salmonella enterica TaxID=28901 RepID=UPI0008281DE6
MSGKRYPEDFIIKAEKQFIERGHSFPSVATRLDIPPHSLSAWKKPPYSRRY